MKDAVDEGRYSELEFVDKIVSGWDLGCLKGSIFRVRVAVRDKILASPGAVLDKVSSLLVVSFVLR